LLHTTYYFSFILTQNRATGERSWLFLGLLLFLGPNLARFFYLSSRLGLRRRGRALFKFIYGAGGVKQFLLARIKRMALAADFRMQFFLRGTRSKRVTAGAGNFGSGVKCRMDFVFHI